MVEDRKKVTKNTESMPKEEMDFTTVLRKRKKEHTPDSPPHTKWKK